MYGRVTITVASSQHTTQELEHLLQQDAGCLRYLTQRGDEVKVYIIPSDNTEVQIKEEFFR